MKRKILILYLIFTASIYSSDGNFSQDTLATDHSAQLAAPRLQIKDVYQKPFTLNNSNLKVKDFTDNTFVAKSLSIQQQGARKSPFRKFLYRYKEQLIFTGVGLGALLVSGIFNSAAKSQYKKENDLYDKYIEAEKGSDFDKLWNDYKEATDKTDAYLNVRGIFGIAAGAIGVSLLVSFALEKQF